MSEAAKNLTDAEEGMILLPDDDGTGLLLRARVGIDIETARNFRVKTNDTIAGTVFKSGHPSSRGEQGLQKVKTEYLVKALLYVPILLKGEPIGVLGVNNRTKDTLFDKHHEELLSNLASYAAIAIENARIHEESINRANELEILVQASQVVNSSLSLDQTLQNICRQLAQVLNVSRTEIYEWDRGENQLRSLARYQHSIWRLGEGPTIDSTELVKYFEQVNENRPFWIKANNKDLLSEAHFVREQGAGSMLVLPIRAENKLLGTLHAFFIDEPFHQSVPTSTRHRLQVLAQDLMKEIILNPAEAQTEKVFELADEINNLVGSDWCQVNVYLEARRVLSVIAETGSGAWLDQPCPYIDLVVHPDLQQALRTKSHINIQLGLETATDGFLAIIEAYQRPFYSGAAAYSA